VTRPTRADLERSRGRAVDDLIGANVRLLFVGINPGLWTAAVNAHFARPGNRFWPALYRAGITAHLVDASEGMPPADAQALVGAGVGVTNLVNVATARADELSSEQLRAGARRLTRLAAKARPEVVAILGLSAYRGAFGVRTATTGRQPDTLGGAQLWVLPNPSGLNAHDNIESLAAWYRAAAEAAGVAILS
jgi:TDG/mug DNA glycosylase family protein